MCDNKQHDVINVTIFYCPYFYCINIWCIYLYIYLRIYLLLTIYTLHHVYEMFAIYYSFLLLVFYFLFIKQNKQWLSKYFYMFISVYIENVLLSYTFIVRFFHIDNKNSVLMLTIFHLTVLIMFIVSDS